MTARSPSLSLSTAFLAAHLASTPARPLVLGIQGPQGSGKSYLSAALPAALAPQRVLPISLDDFYLPFAHLQTLADTGNTLWGSRGLPGTHEVPLAVECIEGLKAGRAVEVPRFEKSLNGGRGDRVPGDRVSDTMDVVVLEGWMVGFRALPEDVLVALYDAPPAGDPPPFFKSHSLAHLLQVNAALREYEPLWDLIDVFVQLVPESKELVWEWRLEQEWNMKAKNGGLGMADDEVRKFVDRYQPGYELFMDGIRDASATWHGNGLGIKIGKQRQVLSTETF